MTYWLIKTEPHAWSWQQQVAARTTNWDGVRNHQAIRNLKAMRVGEKAMFYHSGEACEIVGIVEIVREYYPDPADPSGRFGMVAVRALEPLQKPVTLASIKADPRLQNLALVRQPRLSVMPIDDDAWALICGMGGVDG